LLLRLGAPVSKGELIELLWDGRPPGKAQATLEGYVSMLRRRLQPGDTKTVPLRTATGSYVLDPDLVEVDLVRVRFNQLVDKADESAPAEAYPLLAQALKLASAPLLGDELDTDVFLAEGVQKRFRQVCPGPLIGAGWRPATSLWICSISMSSG
jgi:SARP family transcriptional regulator, regulator of embCAB operon